MTEETKKLFAAPWQICGDGCQVCDIRGTERASCDDLADSGRLVRLPELYDALTEAVYDACQDCLVERSYVSEDKDYDLIGNGCVYPERDCCEQCRKWIGLLRKVRDGK